WPLIVTSVDALVDQARPVWGRFLEDHVVGHRLARPRLQGIVLTDVGSLGLRLLKDRAVGDRGGAEQRGRDGDRLVDVIDGDRTGRHRCWNGRQQEQADKETGDEGNAGSPMSWNLKQVLSGSGPIFSPTPRADQHQQASAKLDKRRGLRNSGAGES